ncbi:MAG: PaaI family thioesterase [Acidobacteriota bacterium]
MDRTETDERGSEASPGEAKVPENPSLMAALGNGRVISVDAEKGRAVLEYEALPQFIHAGGAVQGGFVTGWIDSAMAHAAMAYGGAHTESSWFATLEVKISFYRPAVRGIYRAEGWVEKSGRSACFTGGRLLDSKGRVIAAGTSTGTWAPRPGGDKR